MKTRIWQCKFNINKMRILCKHSVIFVLTKIANYDRLYYKPDVVKLPDPNAGNGSCGAFLSNDRTSR